MKRVQLLLAAVGIATLVTVPSAHAIDDHLKCYKIKDPNKFKGIVDLNTSQFGDELGCNLTIKASFFCAPASKDVVDSGGLTILPVVGQDLTNDQVCYKLKCAAPFPPDTDITDQFGSRTVEKLKPQFLCVPAIEGPPPGPPPGTNDHLKCYKVKDRIKAKGIVDLTTPQFGTENGCKLAIKARNYCVPASKTVVDDGGAPVLQLGGQTLTNDQLCYKVKCPKPFPPDLQAVSDQFGTRPMSRLKPSLMCSPAFITPPPPTTTTTTTTTVPSDACEDSPGLDCGGTCAGGAVCALTDPFSGACSCVDPADPCNGTAPVCNGTCPSGETCTSYASGTFTGSCGCIPDGQTICGGVPGVCGGACPGGSVCGTAFSLPVFGGDPFCTCGSPGPCGVSGFECAPGFGCAIIPPGTTLCVPVACPGAATYPTCGGDCGVGGTCAAIDFMGFQTCVCALAGVPCDSGCTGLECSPGQACVNDGASCMCGVP